MSDQGATMKGENERSQKFCFSKSPRFFLSYAMTKYEEVFQLCFIIIF